MNWKREKETERGISEAQIHCIILISLLGINWSNWVKETDSFAVPINKCLKIKTREFNLIKENEIILYIFFEINEKGD